MKDVVIIGSGLIGAAMAVSLAKIGLNVAVVEASPPRANTSLEYDGRTSAIAQGSLRVLSALNIWQQLNEISPINDIRVCDNGGHFYVHYDHREAGNEPFGYIVENRLLRLALEQAVAQESAIEMIQPDAVKMIEDKSSYVSITLENGRMLNARLMLVADGKFSRTRDILNIAVRKLTYNQTAMVCTLSHSLPHNGVAVERFMPAGPFALLPMTHQRTNVVWAESDEMAAHMMTLSDDERLNELRMRVGSHLGDISLTGKTHSYPLILLHAQEYIRPRIALIGDAAHAIHPIAGQGANLGYRDVAAISEVIADRARLGLDWGAADALAQYQRWRRFDTITMTSATDTLNRLFSNSVRPIRMARDVGLGVVNQIKPVKRMLMQNAMGLTGDLPRMMRGEAA